MDYLEQLRKRWEERETMSESDKALVEKAESLRNDYTRISEAYAWRDEAVSETAKYFISGVIHRLNHYEEAAANCI